MKNVGRILYITTAAVYATLALLTFRHIFGLFFFGAFAIILFMGAHEWYKRSRV